MSLRKKAFTSMIVRLFPFLLVSALSACSAVSPQLKPHLGFSDVQREFSQRSGHTLHWKGDSDEDRRVTEKLEALLALPLTTERAVQIALLENHTLQALYEELGVAQADLVQAGLLSNPTLSASVRFPPDGIATEFSIVENFVELFQIPLRSRGADADFQGAKIRLVGSALSLAYTVRQASYTLQSTTLQLAALKKILLAQDAAADLAKRRHSAGNLNDLELAQAEFDYESIKVALAEKQSELIERQQDLIALMGLDPGRENIKWSSDLGEPTALGASNAELMQQATANSVELASSRERLGALATKLHLQKEFRFLQNGDLGVSPSKESGGKWGFGPVLSVTLPLFDQGQARVFAAEAEFRQEWERYRALQIRIRTGAESAWRRYQIAQSKVSLFKKKLAPLQRRSLRESQRQYNGMFIGAPQLIEARVTEIRNESDYIAARAELWLARSRLELYQSGKIPPEDSERITRW